MLTGPLTGRQTLHTTPEHYIPHTYLVYKAFDCDCDCDCVIVTVIVTV